MHTVLALSIVLLAAQASASGWHDYRLEIAPDFAVVRMNSFEVCLAGRGGLLLLCPLDEHPTFGPLVEYAVTDDSIITKHLGSRPHEKNPAMWESDPSKEFFFLVRREDQHITGPFTRQEWEKAELPALSSIEWVTVRNPNFWTPLLGDLFFVGFSAVYLGWPVLVATLVAWIAFWLFRRSRRSARAAA